MYPATPVMFRFSKQRVSCPLAEEIDSHSPAEHFSQKAGIEAFMVDDYFGDCPKCGSTKVIRSPRRGIWERLLKLFSANFRFYECHGCHARYRRLSRR